MKDAQKNIGDVFDFSVVESEMLKRCKEIYKLTKKIQSDIRGLEICSILEGENSRTEKKDRESIHQLMEDIQETFIEQELIYEEELIAFDEQDFKVLKRKSSPTKKIAQIMFTIVSYVFLLVVIAGVALFGGDTSGNTPPRDILGLGYSSMIVLSGSMQREYPRGSMILTRQVDPDTLEIGDDITFLSDRGNRVVTHRIVGIYENYDNRERGFRTQGIENSRADYEVVRSANIVGQVIFSSLAIGQGVTFVRSNIIFIMGAIILLSVAIVIMKRFLLSE